MSEPFVVVPVRFRREHGSWTNAEVAAWLDLLMASYQVGGTFDNPNVARAYLGGRAGALDALIERGAFIEDGDDWRLADYAELYDGRKLRDRKSQAERLANAEAKIKAGEPLTDAERAARHRARLEGADIPDARIERKNARADERKKVDQEGEEIGVTKQERDITNPAPKGCPECPGTLVRKAGSRGDFLSCDQYPTCRYSEDMPKAPGWQPSAADLAIIEAETPTLRRVAGQ